jgi:Tfp pilus assembly protein PilN
MAGNGGTRIGIALGDQRAVAVVLGKKGAPVAATDVSLGEDLADLGPGLQRVFGVLKAGMEAAGAGSTEGASVHLALLPPLADARLIPFPPMRNDEVVAVLSRDVARYFLGANRPRVVGVRLPNGNGRKNGKTDGESMKVLAAAVHLALVEVARSSLEDVGWRPVSFSAAHGGWLAAATSSKGTPLKAVVAVVGDTAHVLRMEGPNPSAARQLPAQDLASVSDALGEGLGRVLVLSSPQVFDGLHGPMAARGWTLSRDPEGWAGAEESAAARADGSVLELVPPSLAEERREKVRRNAAGLVGAAVVCVLAAAAVQLWGAHRELGAVEALREDIRPQVAPLLETRDLLNELTARAEALEELEAANPIWTRPLVELAALLPEDTYLTALFASGDTVEIEAAGARAGEAIQALRESGLFEEVRLQGIVERKLDEGETVEERFRLWALLPSRRERGRS